MSPGIRTLPGINGPVIIAAWCPTCDQEAMPDKHGRCVWCETRIVNEAFAKAWT